MNEEAQLQQQDRGTESSTETLLVRVHDRINTCLDASRVKDCFEQEGLLTTSLAAATHYVERLHELIPGSFLTQSPNYCWEKNVTLKVHLHDNEVEAWGSYGDIETWFKGKSVGFNRMIMEKHYQRTEGDSLDKISQWCVYLKFFLLVFVRVGQLTYTHFFVNTQ